MVLGEKEHPTERYLQPRSGPVRKVGRSRQSSRKAVDDDGGATAATTGNRSRGTAGRWAVVVGDWRPWLVNLAVVALAGPGTECTACQVTMDLAPGQRRDWTTHATSTVQVLLQLLLPAPPFSSLPVPAAALSSHQRGREPKLVPREHGPTRR